MKKNISITKIVSFLVLLLLLMIFTLTAFADFEDYITKSTSQGTVVGARLEGSCGRYVVGCTTSKIRIVYKYKAALNGTWYNAVAPTNLNNGGILSNRKNENFNCYYELSLENVFLSPNGAGSGTNFVRNTPF